LSRALRREADIASTNMSRRAAPAGADAHLNKPIAAAELLGELEARMALAEAA
jgi:hypothetical protein